MQLKSTSFSITTNLPALGVFFIEEIAKKNNLQYVIIQHSKCRFSIRDIIFSVIPNIFNTIYYFYKIKNYKLWSIFYSKKILNDMSLKYNFTLIYTSNINDDENVYVYLEESRSDYFLVLGGSIIKGEVINKFKGLWVNGHGGVLPEYRGLCSEYWAIKNKELNMIGSTIHYLSEQIDLGVILKIKRIHCRRWGFIFMVETFNHLNLIDNYIDTVMQLSNGNINGVAFNKVRSSYYSSVKYYSIKKLLPYIVGQSS